MITITTIEPAHFDGLAQLQLDCYPTLGPHELMTVAHFAKQYEVFPQGQIVVLDGGSVIGQGSGFFIDFDFAHPDTPSARSARLLLHQPGPAGAWYCEADISVHPDCGSRGIGKRICRAQGGGATPQPTGHRTRAASSPAMPPTSTPYRWPNTWTRWWRANCSTLHSVSN
ncbi:MAG: hypothetical protein R2854_19300 [Caldilineaceae bacterium]